MRTILITGATRGFGKLMVEEFIAHGDRVIATGRAITSRPDIFARLKAKVGDRLIEHDLDVMNPEQRETLALFCEKLGELDLLINNAGAGLFGALEDLSEQQIREQMELNFFGTVFLTRRLLPLVRRSYGRIFNFSSVFGFMGFPLTSAYCASKFAIEGLTESLDYELRPHGVRVCLIEPGAFKTDFTSNQLWGATPSAASPYWTRTKSYRELRENRMSSTDYADPALVARGVLKLSLKKNPPLRARFGRDAAAAYWLLRLLPVWFTRRLLHFALLTKLRP